MRICNYLSLILIYLRFCSGFTCTKVVKTKIDMKVKILSDDEMNLATMELLKISSAHFTSQALHSFVDLKIADIISNKSLSLQDISEQIGPNTNKDALLRILRLLTSVDIIENEYINDTFVFRLTNVGYLLQTKSHQPSMASCVHHWLEDPLWNVGQHLTSFIRGDDETLGKDPFTLRNGVSSDFYYNKNDHPQSLQYANDFVRFISDSEINAVVHGGIQWSEYDNKVILDVGGFNGKLLSAIHAQYPKLICKCLDLPQVIDNIEQKQQHVELIPGDIFDTSSIPKCDVIILKHFLDRCMWSEQETECILKTCYNALPNDGVIIIFDAVLPDASEEEGKALQLSLDFIYMLVGRERQRTQQEWRILVEKTGLKIDEVIDTHIPTCSAIVLTKA